MTSPNEAGTTPAMTNREVWNGSPGEAEGVYLDDHSYR
jgi:hypothetical protein